VQVEAAYRQHFEVEPLRASVSFVGVDPIEILLYPAGSGDGSRSSAYLSLGMSRFPMVGGSDLVVSPDGPRAELMVVVRGHEDEVWRRLAVLAAAPAVESVVYSVGARLDLGEPWLPGSRCTGVVVGPSPLSSVGTAAGMVDVFQVVPATQTELAWARVHGNEQLAERWRAAGTDLTDLFRDPVELR
jgi:hypothetical protein